MGGDGGTVPLPSDGHEVCGANLIYYHLLTNHRAPGEHQGATGGGKGPVIEWESKV